MDSKVNVRTKIVVNGREYKSVDELPPEIRDAYRKALQGGPQATSTTRIVFNGQSYDSVDAMPPEARALFDAAMATVEHGGRGAVTIKRSEASAAIEPGAGGQRWGVAVAVGAALLALLYWMVKH